MRERPAQHLLPRFEAVYGSVAGKAPPECHISFYAYVDTKSTIRRREGALLVRLSDHLAGAPDAVVDGIFAILVGRLARRSTAAWSKHIAAYDAYVRSESVANRRSRSRQHRGRKHIDPVGDHRSLLESYLRVCTQMALHVPEPPRLSWSQTVSRRRFGHWDKDHAAIVISRALDDAAVPEFVLDFVMYHEILHILHPAEQGARRRIHTAAFQAAEARYPRKDEAEQWLQKLAKPVTKRRRLGAVRRAR